MSSHSNQMAGDAETVPMFVLLRLGERGACEVQIQADQQIRRGDVYYADLSPVIGSEQGGIRPVVILQNNVGNRHSPTVIAAAITGQRSKARLPTHVQLGPFHAGLRCGSTILLEQLRTIDKARLRERIGALDNTMMAQIDQALAVSVGLDHDTSEISYGEEMYGMAEEQKSWLYIRAWSDESQRSQEDLLRNYAAEHGYTIVGQSCDLHVPRDRNQYGLASMLDAAQNQEFQVLLVQSWQRLGRDLASVEKALSSLHQCGITVCSLKEPEITLDNALMVVKFSGAMRELNGPQEEPTQDESDIDSMTQQM